MHGDVEHQGYCVGIGVTETREAYVAKGKSTAEFDEKIRKTIPDFDSREISLHKMSELCAQDAQRLFYYLCLRKNHFA